MEILLGKLGYEGAHQETSHEAFKIFKDAVSMYTC